VVRNFRFGLDFIGDGGEGGWPDLRGRAVVGHDGAHA
jgi:hypothetical protein